MPLALAGLVLAWAAALLFGAMEFDRGLLIFFYAGDRPDLRTAASWLTELGGGNVLLAATGFGAGILLYRRDWRGALLLAGISLSGRLLIELQKDWTARLRPDPQGHLVPVETFAFPSGHAANATMVWLCLALLVPRRPRTRALAVWAAVWLALAVGTTRVMLGVHWPSDVIGGWALGLFWALALLRLSGHPLDEGTPAPPPHFPPVKESEDGGPHPSRRP
jgi:undecaprenyl-diphosphatase